MESSERIETTKDFADTPGGMARRWGTEIEAAVKELGKFHEDGDKIVERYLDKRDEWGKAESRVNLFWSTVKVLLSMLYARPPKASVSRAFQDSDDDQARVAGQILQRLLNKSFDDNISAWDAAVRQGIEDWLVVGAGQVWLRYEVETALEEVPAQFDPLTGVEIAPAQTVERIVDEDAPCDYVFWKDFLYSPARTWGEVRWVARRVYMTREQLEARFGPEIAKVVPMVRRQAKQGEQQLKNDPWARAEVFEIWCKENRKVYWYAKGMDTILDYKDDPLGLENFFPCPKPLVANVTSSNFIPRADYVFAQDQFDELDEINTRITWLTRATKVVGVYDKSAGDSVGRVLLQASENQLIPVDNWAMFAEAGGIKGKMEWVPIEAVVNCIDRLRQYRADKTQQIYEVLGISDIMRGASRASETAAAQQIKAQFGSTRIQLSQFYIAEWITHALRIKAEIIAKHWQPETIIRASNIERTPDAAVAMAAIGLLKNTELAEYRISVEADSMAAMDWAAERDAAVQFMQGLGAFISQVSPVAQSTPGAGPFLLRLMQWAVSKFRVSSEIEGVLDQAVAAMQQQLMNPPPPAPNPELEKLKLEAEKIKSNERIAMLESQSDEKVAALKATVELQKVEMQARFDQVAAQYQQIADMMAMVQKVNPVMQLDGLAASIGQMSQSNAAQMDQLLRAVTQKRRRVPIRDQSGEIVEVREIDDDPSPSVQIGPPGAPAIN
jgi:DNA-binding protein H-NS